MKTDSEKMVQGTRDNRQGYLHAAFVVEAEVDGSIFYSF